MDWPTDVWRDERKDMRKDIRTDVRTNRRMDWRMVVGLTFWWTDVQRTEGRDTTLLNDRYLKLILLKLSSFIDYRAAGQIGEMIVFKQVDSSHLYCLLHSGFHRGQNLKPPAELN